MCHYGERALCQVAGNSTWLPQYSALILTDPVSIYSGGTVGSLLVHQKFLLLRTDSVTDNRLSTCWTLLNQPMPSFSASSGVTLFTRSCALARMSTNNSRWKVCGLPWWRVIFLTCSTAMLCRQHPESSASQLISQGYPLYNRGYLSQLALPTL